MYNIDRMHHISFFSYYRNDHTPDPAEALFEARIDAPALWTPETPNLYGCVMELLDENGDV